MPKVTSLGHIGLHCNDFPTMFDFYTRVLGFTVTDKFPDREACFLSARPAEEHHELLLTSGRTAPDDTKLLQQLSMHVDSLEDLKAFHQVFLDEGVKEERIITHGNTASIYFRGPGEQLPGGLLLDPRRLPAALRAAHRPGAGRRRPPAADRGHPHGEREGVGGFRTDFPFHGMPGTIVRDVRVRYALNVPARTRTFSVAPSRLLARQ